MPPTPIPYNFTTCNDDALKMAFRVAPFTGEVADLMLSTFGKGFGDLGDYETCVEIDVARYAWVGRNLSSAVGLCVPASCTAESLPYAVDFFLETILGPFFNSSKDVAGIFKFHVLEPHGELDEASSALIAFLSLLLFTILLCSGIDLWYRLRRQRMDRQGYLLSPDADSSLIDDEDRKLQSQLGLNDVRLDAPAPVAAASLLRSCPRLFSMKVSKEEQPVELPCFNGLRVISFLWLVLGHSYLFMGSVMKNPTYLKHFVIRRFSFQLVLGSRFAVDVFFFLSGFLAAYSVFRLYTRSWKNSRSRSATIDSVGGTIVLYLYRWCRLWPTYAVVLLIWAKLSPRLATGPMWSLFTDQVRSSCSKQSGGWWESLLLIQDFVPSQYSSMCLSWGWYVAVDLQLYLLVPPVVLLYRRSKLACAAVCAAVTVASLASSMAVASTKHLSPNLYWTYPRLPASESDTSAWQSQQSVEAYLSDIFRKPFARAAPYFIGVSTALWYLNTMSILRDDGLGLRVGMGAGYEPVFSKVAVVLGSAFALLLMFLAVFGPYKDYSSGVSTWSHSDNTWYITFSSSIFALGTSILTVFCLLGHCGPFGVFMSASFWRPLAKLCYAGFLIHPLVIHTVIYSSGSLWYYRDVGIVYLYATHCLLSFGLAAVLFVVVEHPFSCLQKLAFAPWRESTLQSGTQLLPAGASPSPIRGTPARGSGGAGGGRGKAGASYGSLGSYSGHNSARGSPRLAHAGHSTRSPKPTHPRSGAASPFQ